YDVIYGGSGNKGNRAVVGSKATSFTLPSQNYDDKSLSAPNIDASGNSKAGLKITGNEQGNEIWAGSGGDSIDGGDGSDTIHGGAGVDIYYQSRTGGTTDVLTDWDENDLIQIFEQAMNGAADVSADTVNGGDVTLNLRHSNGPQTLVLKGMAGKNIRLQKTEDRLYNVIYGGSGKKGSRVVVDENDTQFGLYSDIGVDNIDASTNTKGIYIQDVWGGGMNYANAIWTGSGDDKIEAAGGDDTVYAAAGNDSILGGDGSDIIYGQAGNDYLDGGNGDDTLSGGTGNNTLFGGNGSDFFVLGSGTDTVSDFNATEDKVRYTGLLANLKSSISGSDVLLTAGASQMQLKNAGGREIGLVNAKGSIVATVTTTGDLNFTSSSIVIDKTFVGSKFDASPYGNIKTIDARKAPQAITIIGNDLDNKILLGSKGSTVKAGAGNDKISVTGGKNKLYGEDGNDSIVGGTGNDLLSGGDGVDTIRGTAGNNSIYGGVGNDVLYGGIGKDTFFYAKGAGNDKIYNFESDKDAIKYTNGALKSVSISKSKVVTLTHASGKTEGTQKLAAMGVYGQSADIITTVGKTTATVTHNFGTYGKKNSWSVDSAKIGNEGFHGSTSTDTLIVTGDTKATIELDKTSLYTSINKVSATKATADLTIKGTSAKDIIYG
ncbi:calcium-binding protein, partial [Selenomonas sp. KH1T6]|uniref:calcium-binding protein n=1 Tax=Selenomonas sp. KH1T6 TaxID=3158784 RepID=UPI001114C73D